jgi:NAD(P)-dependent dehydrogenase (short-subunit alcohol dehydrogenase family)
MSQPQQPQPQRLAGRLALVTGATRGIGRAVAIAYAREGAHTILVGRTAGALEEVDDEIRALGGSATLLTLDLKRHDKIDALGPTVYQRWQKLDILVGNAGILGPLSPLGHITAEAWDEVLEVNLTANWRLIRTLDPLLRRSDAGRAIFVSSGAAANPRAYWGAYAVSKAALEALVKTYAREVENSAVRVNLVNPGPTRTSMRAKAYPGEDPATLKAPEDVAETFVRLAEPACNDNGRLIDLRSTGAR